VLWPVVFCFCFAPCVCWLFCLGSFCCSFIVPLFLL
jgi:hypothetical protein